MTHWSWDHQFEYFGEHPDFQCLVFDNRGVGLSDCPQERYTTSEMARDTYDLLECVGWKEDIHVVGVSMGGMIAQELCLLIPDRVISLCLTSTTPGRSIPPGAAITNLPRTLMIRDAETRVHSVIDMVFPPTFLSQPSTELDPTGIPYPTNREALVARLMKRMAATRPQPPFGAMAQLGACITHYVSDERLRSLKGKLPILIVTGTWDNLIRPVNSHRLASILDARLEIFDGCGHALVSEQPKRYNALLEEHFRGAQCVKGS
ncbi:hypothetical protein HDV00_003016 [Rhizophlyctis rosea]|nr:hypothetical protein HDV00_003016 [Rhizophlyctis rosea]